MIKILVVDDDKTTAKHLAKYFSDKLGHVSFSVSNPEEVLPLIEREAPHVILLDVFMPQMNGLELLKQIKEKYGNTVKVIMITVAGEDDENEAVKRGADDFVRKPFDRDYLRDVVMEKIEEVLGYRRKGQLKEKEIPSVLIVDDEAEVVEDIKYFLKRIIECRIDTAEDGNKAFSLIEKKDYDLIFLDMKMPKMSGLDLMRKIKTIKPLPDILVVTAYADGGLAEQVKEEGAIEYIPKPIFLQIFKKKVKEVLKKKGKYIEKGS